MYFVQHLKYNHKSDHEDVELEREEEKKKRTEKQRRQVSSQQFNKHYNKVSHTYELHQDVKS